MRTLIAITLVASALTANAITLKWEKTVQFTESPEATMGWRVKSTPDYGLIYSRRTVIWIEHDGTLIKKRIFRNVFDSDLRATALHKNRVLIQHDFVASRRPTIWTQTPFGVVDEEGTE